MRIGIDAMGGDRAPVEQVRGALAARALLQDDDKIVLVGDEPLLLKELESADGWRDFVQVRHAASVVRMDESPVEALRAKPDSSIAVLFEMHKADELDACISAGNTGACVVAAQMRLRRLRGVHRPGITIVTPTYHGPVAICDVGANVNCRPRHLHQYGVMASVYLQSVGGVESPRVGLLSIGEEDGKGTDLIKRTRELMKDDPHLNFIGNVEGRDLFSGICDVVVCDGFTGNVVLKLMEGMAEGVLTAVMHELAAAMPGHADLVKRAAGSIVSKYDFNEYGGAPLLGVSGICIICHGASDFRGFKNAVQGALDVSKSRVNEKITQLLSQRQGATHE